MPSAPASVSVSAEAVRVVVQTRPLLPFEVAHGAVSTLHLSAEPPCVRVSRPLTADASFPAFDAVYAAQTGDRPDELYAVHVSPLVAGLFSGFNATVFAYGQTSAGKSYTMHHVTAQAASQLFETKRELETKGNVNVTVRVGFVEIYRERIRDLVDGTRAPLGVVDVQVRERKAARGKGKGKTAPSVFLDGAKERCVTEEGDLMDIIREGALVRQTASTGMNASSSRSHSIITITVQLEPLDAGDGKAGPAEAQCLSAKLHLVDLAGSERAKRTAVVGERFAEGVEINKGLFALAKVISTLADNASRKDPRAPKAHVPYRDSKLTRLLQDSLGGNARTLLVACVSPADTSREETVGTLRYAERAKSIKNRPKVNTEADSVEISDLRARLARARAEIATLAAENERLRACIGPRRRRSDMSNCPASARSPLSSPQTSSLTSLSCSPPPPPRMDPLIVTREDDLVTGLKYRIMELEGMLDRANLSAGDREALLDMDSDKVVSRSPLGKLKEVGLAALSHVDNSDGKRKTDSKSREAHGPRRRTRTTNPSTLRRGGAALRADPYKPLPAVEPKAQVEGGMGFRARSISESTMPARQHAPQRIPTRLSPVKNPLSSSGSHLFGESDGNSLDQDEDGMDPNVMNAISASRMADMRRTFLQRLRQAEADKSALDSKRIQVVRRMSALQRKHEKEIEELKGSHQSRLAGMRTKIADVKRLEAESTRLTKLRDGSDAARKKLLAKVKVAEKQRDELVSKLDESRTKAESMKRTYSKEKRELSKSERLLRAELRKCEVGKSRQEAVSNRLRMENETMKNKLRDVGRQQVRRANSGITPRASTRATTY